MPAILNKVLFFTNFHFLQLSGLPPSRGRSGGDGRRFRFMGRLMSHVMNTYAVCR
jgi:hypothetical protein